MTRFHLLGLFPGLFDGYFSHSLIGKARAQGLVEFHYHQLRDFSGNAYKGVDDKPYGGGAGMVFTPDVVCCAVRELKTRHALGRVILTSPRGRPLTPTRARELAVADAVLFLCARYEGVDQRAIDAVVDDEISVGDYIISGGELAACVIIDAACRFIPGVVGNAASVARDSFEGGLLEYPHFTRPEVFEGVAVPPVLLSGDHAQIDAWRRQEALRLTWRRRPDLLKNADLTAAERDFVKELIHRQR
jgi:tRNA (guanine37-N1)-methyltransferase